MPTSKDSKQPRQSSQYDKIIKENLEATLPVIIKELLGLDIVESEELPDDLQHTKERKPDALKKVIDTTGDTYVLHVEFQVKDEKQVVYRMVEYCAMLLRRYQLPVRQYVIYLGSGQPTMPALLDTEYLKFNFNLVSISQANYKLFLKSDNPEVKMLGILGNFGRKDSLTVVREIIDSVKSHTKGDFAESRYFKQLRIFVQLRSNIGQQFEKVMETITKFFKEEKDYLFRKGAEKERAKAEKEKLEEKLKSALKMKKSGFEAKLIAEILELPIEEVEKL